MFLICLNYLRYLSNLLEITYYLNNEYFLLEPSPRLQFLTSNRVGADPILKSVMMLRKSLRIILIPEFCVQQILRRLHDFSHPLNCHPRHV